MSWKAEVLVAGETKWHSNALRFATKDEADNYARDLMWRWTAVKEWRVAMTDEEATHRWSGHKSEPIPRDRHV